MKKEDVLNILQELKHGVRVYTPFKYFKGLKTREEVIERYDEIRKKKDVKGYAGSAFSTDLKYKTKESKYTTLFYERYPNAASIIEKSRATGMPLDILEKVFEKGRAAWRTGHRVGATPEQWGYARVHSFLVLGCTAFGSDFKLLREGIGRMSASERQRFVQQPVSCPRSTLESSFFKKMKGWSTFVAQYRTPPSPPR